MRLRAIWIVFSVAAARGAEAQALGVSASIGLFNPGGVLAAAGRAGDADVRLDASVAASAGLDLRLSGGLALFADVDYAATRMAHTTSLNVGPPVRPYSTVQVYAPVAGLALLLPAPSALVRTRFRVGGGYAIYRFEQTVLSKDIRSPAMMVGIGFAGGGAQRVGYTAEVRCLFSRFEASALPLRTASTQTTTQRDWTMDVGLRFGL